MEGHSMNILKSDPSSRINSSKPKYGHNPTTSNESQESILALSKGKDSSKGGIDKGAILKTVEIDVKRSNAHDAKAGRNPKIFFESD